MARRLSYSNEVKNELAHLIVEDTELLRAELIAMLASCAIIGEGRIDFYHANAAVTRKVFTLRRVLAAARPKVISAPVIMHSAAKEAFRTVTNFITSLITPTRRFL